MRTYISINGTEWTQDIVCVFDGLQNVLEHCLVWYEDKINSEKVGDLARDDLKGQLDNGHTLPSWSASQDTKHAYDGEGEGLISVKHQDLPIALPMDVQIHTADPITDRKSVFVGRACRISHPSDVSKIGFNLCMRTLIIFLGSPYFISFNVR